MRADGAWSVALSVAGLPLDAPATALMRSWIEYAVRLAASTIRTADCFYEPAAVVEANVAWDARVLAAAAVQRMEVAAGEGVADVGADAWASL